MRQILTQSGRLGSTSARNFVSDALAQADVAIDGNSLGDISVHDERLFDRLISQGSLDLGESYMDG